MFGVSHRKSLRRKGRIYHQRSAKELRFPRFPITPLQLGQE
jgi:hypothetical protein